MPARFGIGDEVALRGTVRLVDAAGDGTVTIELGGTGQRVTVMAQGQGRQGLHQGAEGAEVTCSERVNSARIRGSPYPMLS